MGGESEVADEQGGDGERDDDVGRSGSERSWQILNYLRTINRYAEKLNDLALRGFTSPEPVIMADFDLTCYQRYTCLCVWTT